MHLPARSWLVRTGAVALAAVTLAGVLGAQSSQAVPSRDLDQVAAQVRDLQMQAGAAHERAEQARDRLAGIQEKLGTISNRLERERREMRLMQSTIEDIARATYASGGLDPTLEVLLAENPAEFLAQAAVMDQLAAGAGRPASRRTDVTTPACADRGGDLRQRGAGTAGTQRDGQRRGRGQRPARSRGERARRPQGGGAAATRRAREGAPPAAARGGAGGRGPGTAAGCCGSSGRRGEQRCVCRATTAAPVETTVAATVTVVPRRRVAATPAAHAPRQPCSTRSRRSVTPTPTAPTPRAPGTARSCTAAAWGQAGVGLTALSYSQWDQTRRVSGVRDPAR